MRSTWKTRGRWTEPSITTTWLWVVILSLNTLCYCSAVTLAFKIQNVSHGGRKDRTECCLKWTQRLMALFPDGCVTILGFRSQLIPIFESKSGQAFKFEANASGLYCAEDMPTMDIVLFSNQGINTPKCREKQKSENLWFFFWGKTAQRNCSVTNGKWSDWTETEPSRGKTKRIECMTPFRPPRESGSESELGPVTWECHSCLSSCVHSASHRDPALAYSILTFFRINISQPQTFLSFLRGCYF